MLRRHGAMCRKIPRDWPSMEEKLWTWGQLHSSNLNKMNRLRREIHDSNLTLEMQHMLISPGSWKPADTAALVLQHRSERPEYTDVVSDSTSRNIQSNQFPKPIPRVTGRVETLSAAADPKTHPDVLRGLSTMPSLQVRLAVAQNPSTPADALSQLATIDHRGVSYRVANNPNTPAEVLWRLGYRRAPG